MKTFEDGFPKELKKIFACFDQAGEELYVVGGAVRDHLLGRPVHDYDLTTSALPEQVAEINPGYPMLDIGKSFGTLVFVTEDGPFEITTFRKDSEKTDGRKPDQVTYTREIEEDLRRRDFTVNAMAYSPKRGLIDLFDGQGDLKRELIRAVGKPRVRIQEDYLRSLRAVRFAAQLGFKLDPDLQEAIRQEAEGIQKLSAERVREEWSKILVCERPAYGIRLLEETGLLPVFLPEAQAMVGFDQHTKYHHLDVFEHTLLVVENTPPELAVRLAAFFHDIGKPATFSLDEEGRGHFYGHDKASVEMAKTVMERLRYSKALQKEVGWLIGRHMYCMNGYSRRQIRRLRTEREESLEKLFALQEADILATRYHMGLKTVQKGRDILKELREEEERFSLRDLAFDGNDLIAMGVPAGPIRGEILKTLFEDVLEERVPNEKKALKKRAEEIFKQN